MDPTVAGNGDASVEPSGDAYGAETPPAEPQQAPEAPQPASPPVAPAASDPAAPAAEPTAPSGYTEEHWQGAAQYLTQQQTTLSQQYQTLQAQDAADAQAVQAASRYLDPQSLTALQQEYQQRAAQRQAQAHELSLAYQQLQGTHQQLGSAYREWALQRQFEPLARDRIERHTEEQALSKVPGLSEAERPQFLKGLHQFIKGRTYHDARDMLAVADAYVELWRGNVLAQRQAEGTDFMGGAGSGVTSNIDALRGDQLWDRVAYKNTPPARKR